MTAGADGVGSVVRYSAAPSFDYVPALDGLRACSVMLVMLSHMGLKSHLPGGFGVTAFFFISGFLITRQILAEQAARGQIRLGLFYMRRLLRLYPALLVMVALGGTLYVALGGTFPAGQVLAAVFYFTNYYARIDGYLGVPDGMYNPFIILWSLAVEEHYYLVFPLLAFLLGRTRLRFALLLCGLIVAVTAWRWHVAEACGAAIHSCLEAGDVDRILQSTDTRIDSILYGAVLAVLLGTRFGPALRRWVANPAGFAAGLGLLLLALAVRDPMFRNTLRFSVQGAGLFLAVSAALFSPRLGFVRAALSCRPMLLVGRWSYSLYLWHSLVLFCAVCVLPPSLWRPAIEGGRLVLVWDALCLPALLVASTGVAALSYYGVEMPMVAFRRRFGSHAVRDGAPATARVAAPPG